MARPILISAALLIVALAACNDDRMPTAPQAAAPVAIQATVVDAPTSGGVSSICLVNRKALSDLDGQLQDYPDDESLQAQHAVQSEITADVCN